MFIASMYMIRNHGHNLPIHDTIEIIQVGNLTFNECFAVVLLKSTRLPAEIQNHLLFLG